ncbi:hypothetical protein ES705_50838 [subsurface metagenome]
MVEVETGFRQAIEEIVQSFDLHDATVEHVAVQLHDHGDQLGELVFFLALQHQPFCRIERGYRNGIRYLFQLVGGIFLENVRADHFDVGKGQALAQYFRQFSGQRYIDRFFPHYHPPVLDVVRAIGVNHKMAKKTRVRVGRRP